MKFTPMQSVLYFLICMSCLSLSQGCEKEEPSISWNATAVAKDTLSMWYSNFNTQFYIDLMNLEPSTDQIYLDTIQFSMMGSVPGKGEILSACPPQMTINNVSGKFISMMPGIESDDEEDFDLNFKFAFDGLSLSTDRSNAGGICILLETIDPKTDPSPVLQDLYQVKLAYSVEPGEKTTSMKLQSKPESSIGPISKEFCCTIN